MSTAPKIHPDAIETFSVPGPDVTHWSCFRFQPGDDTNTKGERLTHESDDGVALREWPIADLSVAAIRERWGSGIFRVGWLSIKGAKRTNRGRSQAVALGDVAQAAPTLPAPAAPPLHMAMMANPIAFMREIREMAREEMATVDRGVENRIGALTQLAQVFVGARQAPAVDPGVAQALGQLGQGMQAIAATLENVNARLAALESGEGDEDDDEDEDDDDEDDDDAPEPDAIDRLMNGAERLAPMVMTVASMVDAQREKRREHPASAPAAPSSPVVVEAPAVPDEAPSSFAAMAAADRPAKGAA
jgi:hypothetical protein